MLRVRSSILSTNSSRADCTTARKRSDAPDRVESSDLNDVDLAVRVDRRVEIKSSFAESSYRRGGTDQHLQDLPILSFVSYEQRRCLRRESGEERERTSDSRSANSFNLFPMLVENALRAVVRSL